MIQLRAVSCAVFCMTAVAAAMQANAQNPAVTISVNATMNRKPINPNIYGVAAATSFLVSDLNVPINRYGGNNASRYNWKLNADNRANDWYFESVPDPSAVAGYRGDAFISATKSANAQAMITI